MEYRHTQYGRLTFYVALFFVVVLGAIATQPDSGRVVLVTGIASALILVIVALFSRLTVTVDRESVSANFGWRWPRHVVSLDDIVSFRRVRNRWWLGWGIRWVPHGWMYNVWGLDAVELTLRSGRVFRIGTDEPGDLLAALSLVTSLRPDGAG